MRRNRGAPVYRGAAGLAEAWYVAILDGEHQVVARLSAVYSNEIEGRAAWLRRKDRRGRLIREIKFVEVVI